MYIAKVPNRNSPPAILIRESYREGGKPKTRTVANISKWKPARIEALRQLLKGNVELGEAQQFEITRSQPHGHVAAVLGTLRKVGIEQIIHSRQSRERDLVVAMIVARIVEPGSCYVAVPMADREGFVSASMSEEQPCDALISY